MRFPPSAGISHVKGEESQLGELRIVWIHRGVYELINKKIVFPCSKNGIEEEIHRDQFPILVGNPGIRSPSVSGDWIRARGEASSYGAMQPVIRLIPREILLKLPGVYLLVISNPRDSK